MQHSRRVGIAITALIILISIADRASAQQSADMDPRLLKRFAEIVNHVRQSYLDKPDDEKLITAAINGMVASLDPHSSYTEPAGLHAASVLSQGEMGGIGVELTMGDGRLTVVSPLDGTPASKAGLLTGDVIAEIDGAPVKAMSLVQAVEKLRGAIGTPVKLAISRQGTDKPVTLTLVRALIRVIPVRSHAQGPDVDYIRITQFNEQTFADVKTAIDNLKSQLGDDKIKGYIIDLRNNPGGLLDQAIAVSDIFLDHGTIVKTSGRNAAEDQTFNARPGDATAGRPIIVLVNGGTSGVSEIVAGALQDNRRATLIGSRTFGYGTIQTIIPIAPGDGMLKLTTARYFTPAGTSIQAAGIKPDIPVQQDDPSAAVGNKPGGEASLPNHIQAPAAEISGSQSYVPPDEKDDKAITLAVGLLRGTEHNSAYSPK